MRFKIIINSIIFIFIVIFTLMFLSYIVTLSLSKEEQFLVQSLYNHDKDSFDIIFVGPSTSLTSWNTFVAWKKHGITSLNYSFPSLQRPAVKYLIKNILKEQKPKILIIEADMLLSSLDSIKYKFFLNNTFPYIPFSFNKILMGISSYRSFNLSFKRMLEIFFPIILYHDFYNEINIKNLINKRKINDYFVTKYPYYYTNKEWGLEHEYKVSFATDIKNLEESGLLDFFKTIKDVNIVFCNIPNTEYFSDIADFSVKSKLLEKTISLIKNNNIDFINLNNESMIKEMNLSVADFCNEEHMNYWGASKYTDYLTKILADKYKLKDKRKDPKYSFWDSWADKYVDDIKRSFNVDIFY